MLFDDDYIFEVRNRIDQGDMDRIEFDLLDALNEIEILRAKLMWHDLL